MTEPKRRGRPPTLDPARRVTSTTLELYENQVEWLDAQKSDRLRSRSEVARRLLDDLIRPDSDFGHTDEDPKEA